MSNYEEPPQYRSVRLFRMEQLLFERGKRSDAELPPIPYVRADEFEQEHILVSKQKHLGRVMLTRPEEPRWQSAIIIARLEPTFVSTPRYIETLGIRRYIADVNGRICEFEGKNRPDAQQVSTGVVDSLLQSITGAEPVPFIVPAENVTLETHSLRL